MADFWKEGESLDDYAPSSTQNRALIDRKVVGGRESHPTMANWSNIMVGLVGNIFTFSFSLVCLIISYSVSSSLTNGVSLVTRKISCSFSSLMLTVALATWGIGSAPQPHNMEEERNHQRCKCTLCLLFFCLLYLVFANLFDCVSPRQDLTT